MVRLPWEKDLGETPQGVKRLRRLTSSHTGKRIISQPTLILILVTGPFISKRSFQQTGAFM